MGRFFVKFGVFGAGMYGIAKTYYWSRGDKLEISLLPIPTEYCVSKKLPKLRYSDLPLSNEHFIGREDTLRLLDSSEPTLILYGESGLGKTDTAIEHARRTLETRPNTRLLFLDGTSKQTLVHGYRKIANLVETFGADSAKIDDNELLRIMRDALKPIEYDIHCYGLKFPLFRISIQQKTLVIIDNVNNEDSLSTYVDGILSTLPKETKTVITTRVPNFNYHHKNIELLPFNTEEAREYLDYYVRKTQIPHDKTTQILDSISKASSFNPDDLRRVAAHINNNPVVYMQQIMDPAFFDLVKSESLYWKSQNPEAFNLLQQLSLLGTNFIPMEVLNKLFLDDSSDFSFSRMGFLQTQSVIKYIYDVNKNITGIAIHDLVRERVLNETPATSVKKVLIKTLGACFPKVTTDTSNWSEAEKYALYAEALLSLEQTESDTSYITSLIGKFFPKQHDSTLLAKLGNYYRMVRKDFVKSKEYLQKALANHHTRDENYADILLSISRCDAVSAQITPETTKNVETAISIYERLGLTTQLAESLSILGYISQFSGNYDEAIAIYKKGIDILKDSEDETVVAKLMTNIGCVYLNKNNFAEAFVWSKKSVELYASFEYSRENEHNKCIPLINTCCVLLNYGFYAQALEYLKYAYTYYNESNNSLMKASVLEYIGAAHIFLEDHKNSLSSLREAKDLSLQVYKSEKHPKVLNAKANLADALAKSNNYKEAESVILEVYNILKEEPSNSGIVRQSMPNVLDTLGEIYSKLGDKEKAHQYLDQATALALEHEYKANKLDIRLITDAASRETDPVKAEALRKIASESKAAFEEQRGVIGALISDSTFISTESDEDSPSYYSEHQYPHDFLGANDQLLCNDQLLWVEA